MIGIMFQVAHDRAVIRVYFINTAKHLGLRILFKNNQNRYVDEKY